jgi:hypothetical protein
MHCHTNHTHAFRLSMRIGSKPTKSMRKVVLIVKQHDTPVSDRRSEEMTSSNSRLFVLQSANKHGACLLAPILDLSLWDDDEQICRSHKISKQQSRKRRTSSLQQFRMFRSITTITTVFALAFVLTQAFTVIPTKSSALTAGIATNTKPSNEDTCLNSNTIQQTTETDDSHSDDDQKQQRQQSMKRTMTRLASARVVPQSKLYVSEPDPQWFGNTGNTPNDPAWTNSNWLKSRFHFSFAEYNNHRNNNFGVMRVCNDDLGKYATKRCLFGVYYILSFAFYRRTHTTYLTRKHPNLSSFLSLSPSRLFISVQPHRGFGTHPHRDMVRSISLTFPKNRQKHEQQEILCVSPFCLCTLFTHLTSHHMMILSIFPWWTVNRKLLHISSMVNLNIKIRWGTVRHLDVVRFNS